MSTLRQKSFLATLALKGKPLIIHRSYNNDTLSVSEHNDTALIFYFRCEGDFYNIYVRSEGNHFGKTLDINDQYIIANSAKATGFTILNTDGKTLTLDSLSSNNENIYLQTRNGKRLFLEVDWSGEGYFPLRISHPLNPTIDHQMILSLNILERNTPYLGFPDEI